MMTMTIETILGIAGAALNAVREGRRWQARCVSVETSLAAMRRELELAACISVKTRGARSA